MLPDYRPGQQRAFEERSRQQRQELPEKLHQADLRQEAHAAGRRQAARPDPMSDYSGLAAARRVVLVVIALVIIALVVLLVHGL